MIPSFSCATGIEFNKGCVSRGNKFNSIALCRFSSYTFFARRSQLNKNLVGKGFILILPSFLFPLLLKALNLSS